MNKEIDTIIESLDEYNLKDAKCYDILREKLEHDNFKKIVIKGEKTADIKGIPAIIFDHLEQCMGSKKFNEFFNEGHNLGNCTGTSEIISYILQGENFICGGILPLIRGTKNSPDGSHTWIEYGDYIIDPTLMLMISSRFKRILGYIQTSKLESDKSQILNARKEFFNDKSIKR